MKTHPLLPMRPGLIGCAMLAGLIGFTPGPARGQPGTLVVEGAAAGLSPGQTVELVVTADGVDGLFGLAFELAFTPSSLLNVLSVQADPAFGSDVLFFFNTSDPDDDGPGRVSIGVTRKAGQGGASGRVPVARVRVQVDPDAPPTEALVLALQNVVSNDAGGNALPIAPDEPSTIPLPVELVSFTARIEAGAVILRWETATEANNAGFEVQRRSGTRDWETLGFVAGAGTTTAPQLYRYTDAALPPDARRVRYRLRQVDFDGTFAYSAEVEVVPALPAAFALEPNHPNPFTTSTEIRYALPEAAPVRLAVYDALGREVAVLVEAVQPAGRHAVRFEAGGLPGGLYLCRLQTAAFRQTRPLMIVR